MGKGFKKFMENPYYKKEYDNSPSDAVKKYLKISFDCNPFAGGEWTEKLRREVLRLGKNFKKEDVEYLAKYASGGMEKSYYKKWLEKFDENAYKMNI